MKQSKLPFKTRKEDPKDEVSLNAKLLIRAGFVNKEMAGVYSFLPLGLKVLKKIENIVREEMNSVGAFELELTALQDKSVWEKTGRWDDAVVDNWFKTKLKNDTEVGLGFTHEEPLALLLRDHVRSYKDLPFSAYQFQTKFRNEARAKSGIMRGREFLMKDLYSFSRDEAEHNAFYEKMKDVYANVYERVGIADKTFITVASGGSFSKFSHEFQALSESGEDTIHVDAKKKLAINKEVFTDEVVAEAGLSKSDLKEEKSIEVGNIFTLGTRFSEPLELTYKDENDKPVPVFMGSYGIGISRLMGTVAELLSDDKGLVWPESIAPFDIHLVALFDKEGSVKEQADKLYAELSDSFDVLYDDRDAQVGAKFADADLIGIPTRVVIGAKTLAEGKVEVVDRKTGASKLIALENIIIDLHG